MSKEKSKDAANSNGSGHKYTMASDNDEDENTVRVECGIGCFKPPALSMCASMTVFTGVYSFSALLTSTLSSYVNSQVTTLERHFGFNSAQTGLIMAANDVGFLVVVLFVSYIAAKVHIPRALGSVTVLFGISGILCALPYFMFGAPSPVSSGVTPLGGNVSARAPSAPRFSRKFTGQICDGDNSTSMNCHSATALSDMSKIADSSVEPDSARANAGVALAIIVIGMVLQGVAKTPRYSFTTTYIDANVEKTKTGFYMGIITTLGIMGPAIAFALGGVFSRIYVTLEETNMHFRHPKWIGAWWLGYITFGCAACVFALPLFCFPRQVKGGKPVKRPATPATQRRGLLESMPTFVKGFLAAMTRLWTNPVYVFCTLSSCSLMFVIAGSQSFTAKYIENQFSFPAWKANMSMAGMMLSTACLGTFTGGYLTKRFKMGPLASLKFIITMQTIASTLGCIMIAFSCQQPRLYNSPGPLASAETMIPSCYDNCGCDDDDYFPICGGDGHSFFSPCHAGCLDSVGRSYMNCSCIAGGAAVAGMCDFSCPMFYPFMVCFGLSALIGTLSIIPKLIIYIRAVEDRDKPLALGFASFMSSIFGWMLGPICFGKLIDGICIQWENSCIEGAGSCRLYDNDNFRLKLYGYQAIFRAVALLFIILALVSAIRSGKFRDDTKGPGPGKKSDGEKGEMELIVPSVKVNGTEEEKEEGDVKEKNGGAGGDGGQGV